MDGSIDLLRLHACCLIQTCWHRRLPLFKRWMGLLHLGKFLKLRENYLRISSCLFYMVISPIFEMAFDISITCHSAQWRWGLLFLIWNVMSFMLNLSFSYALLSGINFCSSDHVLQTPLQGWIMAIVSCKKSGKFF